MQTEREWLAAQKPPLAKLGARGRFSRDAIEALEKAKRDGVQFVPKTAPSAPRAPRGARPKDETPAEVSPVISQDGIVAPNPAYEVPKVTADTPTPSRSRDGDVFVSANGIRKSFRDVCARCQFSIGWCRCAAPYAHDGENLVPLTRTNK